MMKTFLLTLPLAILLGGGCGSSEDTAPAQDSSRGENPLTAPVDYLGAVGSAQKSATKTTSTVGLSQAIQLYKVQEGQWPQSLQALVPDYIARLPDPPVGMKFEYNPSTGELKLAAP